MTTSTTGSFGPFEEVRTAVYNMALGLIEAHAVEKLMQDPTPQNLEILASYMLTDPRILKKDILPN